MSTVLVIAFILLVTNALAFYFVRRYYQRLLKRELGKAQKSERLKSVFLANVSRSLRKPLNAILGYSNIILAEENKDLHASQVRDLVSLINADSQQLLGFIGQLLELSNYEGSMPSFTLIEVNLAELMASYRREAMNVTRPDVSVVLRSDLSPHCKATLDTNFMHQLMMHLLTEAAKNTMKGDIMVNFKYERHGLKVAITYGGVGKTDLLTEDIYSFLQKEDAMMLTKDNSRFGLSICKAIIDALGGELDFETGNGSKTVASFWFPCKMRDKHKR
ncbi:sensor histidine kinase [Xylanibacter brevis]|uniref:sensor histidine kinase n=1 Tax=Xylanibacter brevis TaxID=83231 RepID=UPI0009DE3694|nr:HAMP domain-containing sensor histidine kinase [Xylanibacter brevis]